MNTNDAYCINIDTPSCLFTFLWVRLTVSIYQTIKAHNCDKKNHMNMVSILFINN